MGGAIGKAEEMVNELGADGYLLQQFNNPDNPKIHRSTTGPEIWRDTDGKIDTMMSIFPSVSHRSTTGPEIWRDTDGKIDIMVGGVGTGGTLTGSAQFLKPLNPALKMVAVEPVESPVLSGGKPGPHKIQGIGAGFVPGNADMSLIDEVIQVSGEDAMEMARNIATKEGIFCGISSGAAVTAALREGAKEENKGKRIVVIIPSFGERYLSTALFQNLWDEALALKPE